MKSSYINTNDIQYKDLFELILFIKKPKKIIEFGILDGYSLDIFYNYSKNNNNVSIEAYDIFDEFNGNHANNNNLSRFNNIINYGDFYKKFNEFQNNSIDLLHIDIANNGDVILFTIDNYLDKISKNGIIIFEGGSTQRDNVEWMTKYNKKPIYNTLISLKNRKDIHIKTFGSIPSITIITKN